jgi:hypothetical protein
MYIDKINTLLLKTDRTGIYTLGGMLLKYQMECLLLKLYIHEINSAKSKPPGDGIRNHGVQIPVSLRQNADELQLMINRFGSGDGDG